MLILGGPRCPAHGGAIGGKLPQKLAAITETIAGTWLYVLQVVT
jgi:hypothetical protein